MINRFIIQRKRKNGCKVLFVNALSPLVIFGVPRPRGGPQGLPHCRLRRRLQGPFPGPLSGRPRGGFGRGPADRLPRCPQRGPRRGPGRGPGSPARCRPPHGHRGGLGSAGPGAGTPPEATCGAPGLALRSAIRNLRSDFGPGTRSGIGACAPMARTASCHWAIRWRECRSCPRLRFGALRVFVVVSLSASFPTLTLRAFVVTPSGPGTRSGIRRTECRSCPRLRLGALL